MTIASLTDSSTASLMGKKCGVTSLISFFTNFASHSHNRHIRDIEKNIKHKEVQQQAVISEAAFIHAALFKFNVLRSGQQN